MDIQKVRLALIQNDFIIFASDYGKKVVAESWTKRLSKQVKQISEFKDFQNYNIKTGSTARVVDVDLDCEEANLLADSFLPATGIEFGRSSTPRAHRLFKVIDLAKKDTRKFYSFKGKEKSMLVELRANEHYTMCLGQYDNSEQVVYAKCESPTEVQWQSLQKMSSLLAAASVILRKYAPEGMRNEYIKLMIAALWQHKINQEDCTRIIEAVSGAASDDVKERLARIANVYKRETSEEIQGLPTLAKQFNWNDDEVKDFKKILLAITGRNTLPVWTHEFVKRIAYMMKQKKYYDLEDKEMYDGEAIDVKYAKQFDGKYTPLKYWKLHKDSKVCVDFTYKPATKERFVHVEKKLMINVYEENDLQPDPKVDTDLYWALVKHVIPHDDCRKHFLDWNAWILQNKGKKIRHGIIFQSNEFQLGKGSLYDVMRDILGRVNAKKIELGQALDKGKGYLVNSMMVLIDEAKSSGKWEEKQLLLNTMKTIMTEGSVGIRQLYKEYTEQDSCSNYWINTNHRDAFALPPNEVRYWVYMSEAKRNEKLLEDFHNARFNNNLAAGVYAEMLDRDVSKFNPLGVAPWTSYRDEMTELADKPLNDYVKEGYEQGVYPLDRSIVTTTELFHYWRDKIKMRVTRERDVAAALQLLRPKPIRVRGCPVQDVGANVNIWIIRDHEKYKDYTAKDLGKIYQGFYTDSNTMAINKIDKASPFERPVFKNATKAGEVDFKKNAMERDAAALPDKEQTY